jgi:hypothetical protein
VAHCLGKWSVRNKLKLKRIPAGATIPTPIDENICPDKISINGVYYLLQNLQALQDGIRRPRNYNPATLVHLMVFVFFYFIPSLHITSYTNVTERQ